jgi:hypothetical protein
MPNHFDQRLCNTVSHPDWTPQPGKESPANEPHNKKPESPSATTASSCAKPSLGWGVPGLGPICSFDFI